MSYVRIWVHVVFSTRNHEQYLSAELRARLIEHININCRNKDIFLDSIGGWSEHLHLLISLGREQNIAKVMMLIKGESAHWQNLIRGKFYWQDDYYAISVSESQVANVRTYIEGQEAHHKAVPFTKELETLEKITRKFG
ncbi:MAG: transposase [Chloracidobacterium sp.]|nr:transposase [Chloracidobacterium sp.]